MKYITGIAFVCGLGLLVGCQSTQNPNQPEFQTQKIYHAPAQIFDFYLGSSVLRGGLKLKQSCSVMGTSLDIQDQLGQQVRVDTFNLNNNPQLQSTVDSTLQDVAPAILALYEQKYQATATAPQALKNTVTETITSRLNINDRSIDIAITTTYGYAYVLQLNSALTQNDASQAQQQLQTLLKAIAIPGQKLQQTSSSLPISFDLSNRDTQARQTWQKTYCP